MCGQVTMRFLLCFQLILLVVVQSASSGAPAPWSGTVSDDCIAKNEEWKEKAKGYQTGSTSASKTKWELLNPLRRVDGQEDKSSTLTEQAFTDIMKAKWGLIWNQASLDGSVEPLPQNAALSVKALILIRDTVKELIDKASQDKVYHNPFYQKPKQWDQLRMKDVSSLIVMPLASGLKVSLARLMQYMETPESIYNEKDPLNHLVGEGQVKNTYVGPITHFVSHDWGGVFNNFVTSVINHCDALAIAGGKDKCEKDSTYYWVCTFANNQYGFYAGDGHFLLETSPFGIALRKGTLRERKSNGNTGLKSVLAIQCDGPECYDTSDPKTNSPSMTMKRIWCVYEMALVLSLKLPLWWSCNGATVFEVTEGTKLDKCTPALQTWMATEQTPQAADVTSKCDKEFVLEDIANEVEDGAMKRKGKSIVKDKSDFRICDKFATTDPENLKKQAPYDKYATSMGKGEYCLTEWFQKFATSGAPKRQIGQSDAKASGGGGTQNMKRFSVASSFPEESNFVILYSCFTLFSLILVALYYHSDRGEKLDIDLAHLLEDENAVC